MMNILLLMILLLLPVSGYADVTDGLVGWWKLDETSGNAQDSSGQDNTGTPNGTTILTTGCKKGNCRQFNGNSDYITIGNKTFIDGSTQASMCVWMRYIPASVTADGALISKWSSASQGWLMWVDDVGAVFGRTNTISFAVDTAPGATGRVEGSSNLVTTGVWEHYCGVFKGGNYIRLYKNGILDMENTTGVVASVYGTAQSIYLSNSADGAAIKYVNAELDDVRIYNRALTANEVMAIYQAGTPRLTVKGSARLNGLKIP